MKDASQLPTEIIHHILSYCTMKEAVNSGITCKNFYEAYSTRPVLKFNEGEIGEYQDAPPILFNPSPQFLKSVSKILHNYQSQLTSIDEVCFRMYENYGHPKIKNKWVEAVIKCLVQRVKFVGLYGPIYVPQSIYQAKCIKELYLNDCRINDPINGNIMFLHLKILSLRNVIFSNDRLLGKILSTCSMIEDLEIYKCYPVNRICLGQNLQDLKKVFIYHLNDNDVPLDLYVPNRMVDLSLTGVTLSERFLDNFAEKFPQIENLDVGNCWFHRRRLCFSSTTLRSLYVGYGFEEVDLNLPHLRRLTYFDVGVPSLALTTTSEKLSSKVVIRCKEKIELNMNIVCLEGMINSSWFLSLRRLLKASLIVSKYSLCLVLQSVVQIEEVEQFQAEPLIDIDQLTLDFSSRTLLPYLGLLLNGLLLVCRPNAIIIPDGITWLLRLEIANSMWKLLMERISVFSELQSVAVVTSNSYGERLQFSSIDAISTSGDYGSIRFNLEWKKLLSEPSLSQGTWKRL